MSSSLPSARLEGRRRSKPHHEVLNVFTRPSERKTYENGEESAHLPPRMSSYPLAPESNPKFFEARQCGEASIVSGEMNPKPY